MLMKKLFKEIRMKKTGLETEEIERIRFAWKSLLRMNTALQGLSSDLKRLIKALKKMDMDLDNMNFGVK